MNRKSARALRKLSGGNRQAYQALKREWAQLSQEERARRRRASAEKPEPADAAPAPATAEKKA
jgi:hypothetical protein